MDKEILVVLGSPNSPTGELSAVSKERLDYCRKIVQKEMMIICTGSSGAHFNTSNKPHAFYTKNYLIEKGIPEKQFLEFALSTNTVEDAVKTRDIVLNLGNVHLTIITSDYHLERVQLIFKEVLKNYKMKFVGVKSNLKKEEYTTLINHEKKAIAGILKNGLYF